MDYLIVKAMCERKVWQRLREQIPKSMLAPDTVALLGWVDLYYGTYTDSNAVQWDAMQTLLGMRGQHLQKEQMDILKHMLKQVQQVPDEAAAGVVRTLNEMAYSGEMAALVQQYGSERIIINSAADWGISDPLKVPKTVAEMRARGIPEETIETIAWRNPVAFFAQSGRLDLDADAGRPDAFAGNTVRRG